MPLPGLHSYEDSGLLFKHKPLLEEMSQAVKNLSLDPRNPCTKLNLAVTACNPGAGGQRQEDPWDLLASQST